MDYDFGKLIIKDLCKAYDTLDGKIIATDHLSATINRGEFVAVTGKSGAGKTTLLNIIGGLEQPDSGSVFIDNVEITRLSSRKSAELRRRRVGIIYQFYNLIPELNVRENIVLPIELDGGQIDEAELASVISKVGLTGREQAFPSMLSGGQQQRAAVARAILNHPAVLLADEPTGNLDTESMHEIIDLLLKMNRDYNITVIIVTHNPEIAEAAGRVISLSDGRIISDRRR